MKKYFFIILSLVGIMMTFSPSVKAATFYPSVPGHVEIGGRTIPCGGGYYKVNIPDSGGMGFTGVKPVATAGHSFTHLYLYVFEGGVCTQVRPLVIGGTDGIALIKTGNWVIFEIVGWNAPSISIPPSGCSITDFLQWRDNVFFPRKPDIFYCQIIVEVV